MRVIPVLDIAHGVAVHARGGDRTRYAAVRSVLSETAGDPIALAAAYRRALGANDLYIADLDAIAGGEPSALVRPLCTTHQVWLDAGANTASRARAVAERGATVVVIGLETLASRRDLEEILNAVDPEQIAFSLDVRDRIPIVRGGTDLPPQMRTIATWAGSIGIRRFIILDLARVGSGRGADLEMLSSVRDWLANAELVAGGGVRDARDLHTLAAAGYDGVLVATAVHEGRVTKADVQAAQGARTQGRGGE